MENTILQLVDLLVATSNRAALAEQANETFKETIENSRKALDEAQNMILELRNSLVMMKEEMEKEKESTTRSINYWADKATKLEAELKALKEAKDDTGGT